MGKKRIIAETGAGQHGVASATVSARFGFPCVVYMGATDVERQAPNVFRMKLLGAEVRPVTAGHGTLKDAMNEALRDWVTNVEDTYYLIGTAAGPHPYPELVREFQSVIGRETKEQLMEVEGRLPDMLVAAVGGGSIYLMGLLGRWLFKKEAMGLGDVKLMAMVGAFLGWKLAILTFFLAPFLGAVYGIAEKIRTKDTAIAYGPFLAGGALISLFRGDALIRWILSGYGLY